MSKRASASPSDASVLAELFEAPPVSQTRTRPSFRETRTPSMDPASVHPKPCVQSLRGDCWQLWLSTGSGV